MRFQLNLSGENVFKISIYLMSVLLLVPIMLTLPPYVRLFLQIIDILLFLISLMLLRQWNYLMWLILLFLVSCLYYLTSWNGFMRPTTYLYNSLCCWRIILCAIIILNGTVKMDSMIITFIMFLVLVTSITTINGLLQYPLAVREMGRSGSSYSGADLNVLKEIYRGMNISSWSQMFGLVFLEGCFIQYYKETKRTIALITIVLTMVCICASQLAFAVLLLGMIATFFIIIGMRRVLVAVIIFILCIGFFFLQADFLLENFIEFSQINGFQMLSRKLRDLHALLVLGGVTGDAYLRFKVYSLSLSTFLEYPFGFFFTEFDSSQGFIGRHSEVFDWIGAMGLLGIAMIIGFVYIWYNKIVVIKDITKRRFMFIMFISFIILAILNPVFYSPQVWIGAFLLPAILISSKSDSINVMSRANKWYSE